MGLSKNFHGELKESSFTPSFVVANSWHAKDSFAPAHSHTYGCLHYTTDGLYEERIEGKDFKVSQGKILYKPPGIEHSNEFRHVGASTCRIALHLPNSHEFELPNRPFIFSNPLLTRLFNRILRELKTDDDLSKMAIEGLSWELVCEVVRETRNRDADPCSSAVQHAYEILRTQFSNPPSISDMSAELGIHRSQLSRAFKTRFGVSLTHFIRQCRIEQSIHLLSESGKSLAEIALECGFNDQSHFTRCFRELMAVTPAKWRKGNFG